MRAGGSKQKGSSFERAICRQLSLWITYGEQEDCFWRSAMSGGSATVAKRKGIKLSAQAGDISAIDSVGEILTKSWYLELKHVKQLGLDTFIVRNTGPLFKYWRTALREARHYGKTPVLIVRQNRFPILLICKPGVLTDITLKPIQLRKQKLASITSGKATCEVWNFEGVLELPFNAEK